MAFVSFLCAFPLPLPSHHAFTLVAFLESRGLLVSCAGQFPRLLGFPRAFSVRFDFFVTSIYSRPLRFYLEFRAFGEGPQSKAFENQVRPVCETYTLSNVVMDEANETPTGPPPMQSTGHSINPHSQYLASQGMTIGHQGTQTPLPVMTSTPTNRSRNRIHAYACAFPGVCTSSRLWGASSG